jgi:hypothetical protein
MGTTAASAGAAVAVLEQPGQDNGSSLYGELATVADKPLSISIKVGATAEDLPAA